MPSPLGHALGGLAAGWLVAGPSAGADNDREAPEAHPARWWRSTSVRRAAAFAGLGVAADLDLVVGRHSQVTHSVGAALVVLAIAAFALRRRRGWATLALAAAAAYGSHVLLDWLGQDATPPLGIMALWPFSHAYYISNLDVFAGISREPWRPGAFWHDVVSVVREVVILLPVAAASWWLRRRPTALQVLPPGLRAPVQEVRTDQPVNRAGESQRTNKPLQ